jgi:hypothetical protein
MMITTRKDIENLHRIAIEARKRITTPEEALRTLVRAGILDKDGNWTKPYKHLGRIMGKVNVRRKA